MIHAKAGGSVILKHAELTVRHRGKVGGKRSQMTVSKVRKVAEQIYDHWENNIEQDAKQAYMEKLPECGSVKQGLSCSFFSAFFLPVQ